MALEMESDAGPEAQYVAALSRENVVDAYSQWADASTAEAYILDRYLEDHMKVADLGCGAGRLLALRALDPQHYIGVDRSAEMIDAAQARFPFHKFQIGDMAHTALRTASFDLVAILHNSLDILYPRVRRQLVLKEAYRCLSRDGIIVCSSHWAPRGAESGYCEEDYHGVIVQNFRSPVVAFVQEIESCGFDVEVALRDERGTVADWTYVVGRKG